MDRTCAGTAIDIMHKRGNVSEAYQEILLYCNAWRPEGTLIRKNVPLLDD